MERWVVSMLAAGILVFSAIQARAQCGAICTSKGPRESGETGAEQG